jgi:hypothetical protein
MESLAARVLKRIYVIHRRTLEGAYILADSCLYVYVLPDDSISSKEWVTKFPKLIVGRYGTYGMPAVQQLMDDLQEHLTTIAVL